ncbi:MAG TPA: peptide ABC transporter substrate-binding protein [Caulobacteraceae bacterium]|nr:peptide ABC transporter substrate-binding protein [Caulobacteraceae bacterium]
MRQFQAAAVATSAILALGAGLAGCGHEKIARPACPTGQVCVEYGNTSDPTSLDPQLVTLTNEAVLMRALFEGLYQDSPKGEAILGLAQSVETSPDGLTWTFHLRPAKWSDGQPVTAHDFVYAYRRILDPKTAASYAYLVYLLKNGQEVNQGKAPLESVGAEAPDDRTLVLHLIHPAPYLPQILKHQSFYPVPEHVVKRWGAAWSQPAHIVGDGPYVLVDWRLGDRVRVVRNPLYYDADKVCVDRFDFLPISDAVSAERRVRRGEIDVSDTIQSSRVAYLKRPDQIPTYVHTHTYLSTAYVIFNTHVPAFARREVRQALSMTVDREFITRKLLRAGQAPTFSFVPPGMAGYVPDDQRPKPYWAAWTFPQRQAEARRLLARAGFGPGHPLKFEMKTANATDTVLMAQAMQADWRAVGVEASLRQEDAQISANDYQIRDFQVGLISWILDYDDPLTFLDLMRSDTGQQNYGDYRNPAYDALLNQANHETDGAVRAQLLRRAEQMIVDDADVAPVDNGVNRNLVSPNITGWVDNFGDIHPAKYLCVKGAATTGRRPGSAGR